MELGDKLKELEMTAEEMDRLGNAFKEEKFRELFREYAEELSDPENKRRYEEEIKILEQNRGNTVEFIHPEPFKALRTRVDGSHDCFINICASGKVGTPSSAPKVLEGGRRGLSWTLPYILHPERKEIWRKGHKVMVYDVVFHPDALHMATKNKDFMDIVKDTAVQGIQSAFSVSLDRKNVREIRAKCKDTPQTCIIRKAVPGYEESSVKPDWLDIPYPDEKRHPTSPQTKAAMTTEGSEIQPVRTKGPTQPNYILKYRSYVDIQDFRYSRDSAQSPRPKEIVVTIDVPLLKEVTGARVEVTERMLLLESEEPAYRLELPLAYPVDEDKGQAKFNKQKGQLTVTLPLLPADETFESPVEPVPNDGDGQVGSGEAEEDGMGREREELTVTKEDGPEEQTSEGKGGKEEGLEEVKKVRENRNEKEEGLEEVKKVRENRNEKEEGLEEVKKVRENRNEKEERAEEETPEEQSQGGFQCDTDDQCDSASEMKNQALLEAEEEHSGSSENSGDAALETTSKMRTLETPEEMGEETGSLKEDAASSSQSNTDQTVAEDQSASQLAPETKTDEASRGISGHEVQEEDPGSPQKQERKNVDVDEDDLPAEQVFQHQEPGGQPPPAVLIEVDEDGHETIISDHSTSAGFSFHNSLIYELD